MQVVAAASQHGINTAQVCFMYSESHPDERVKQHCVFHPPFSVNYHSLPNLQPLQQSFSINSLYPSSPQYFAPVLMYCIVGAAADAGMMIVSF